MAVSCKVKEEVASNTSMDFTLTHMSILQEENQKCHNYWALKASIFILHLVNNLSG